MSSCRNGPTWGRGMKDPQGHISHKHISRWKLLRWLFVFKCLNLSYFWLGTEQNCQ